MVSFHPIELYTSVYFIFCLIGFNLLLAVFPHSQLWFRQLLWDSVRANKGHESPCYSQQDPYLSWPQHLLLSSQEGQWLQVYSTYFKDLHFAASSCCLTSTPFCKKLKYSIFDHVLSSSYPNVTLSKVELYASDHYDRAKETLQVQLRLAYPISISLSPL